jgi:hypothetical protein
MADKQQLEQPMEDEQIREALNAHWHASAVGDANAEHDIHDYDAICDYPQSGERILGEAIYRPCAVIIPAAVRFQRQANSRER